MIQPHYFTFKSRKDRLYGGIIFGISFMLLGIFVVQLLFEGWHIGLLFHVVNFIVIGFLLWLWYGTYYCVDNRYLHYQSGPLRGKIPIETIREIERDTTMWTGYRLALARKGVIVKYNRFDDIYLSPDNNDTFIEALLVINPDIQIKHKA